MCSISSKSFSTQVVAILARVGPILALLATLGGCSSPLRMTPPEGFLILEESRTEIKAASSDSILLWARSFDDPYAGDLDFWSSALYNELVEQRGYTLISEQPLHVEQGADHGQVSAGREMLFQVTTHGAVYSYLVSLFVAAEADSGEICVVELVGQGEGFDRTLDDVRRAIMTVRF